MFRRSSWLVINLMSPSQAHLSPTKWSECGGAYLGFDNAIHHLSETPQFVTGVYTDMSIWDIARTQYPLLAWLQPQVLHCRYFHILQDTLRYFQIDFVQICFQIFSYFETL